MTPRPLIFVSAVTKELKSARQLVANTLTFLGYQPVWQDVFGTEGGDLRGMLREKIDECKGVVQLVGRCYGAEPPTPDEKYGRVSYTQYEAFYARERGKKVWYLFIDENYPADSSEQEPEELRELQTAYRRRLQSDTHVFHQLTSTDALERSVLRLRDDLTRLRRGVKQWAAGVIALLLVLLVATIWLVQTQRRQTGIIQKQGEQVTTIVEHYQKMQQALVRLAEVETQSKQLDAKLSQEEQRAAAYRVLEKDLGLPAGLLAKELPGFALELYSRADTTPLLRARAAYALNKFGEAEKLSLEGAAQDRQAYETGERIQQERRTRAIESYVLAGQSARKLIQYDKAMEHFREAEKLTDRERDPKDWATVQYSIGSLLDDQGQYSNADDVLRSVIEVRTHTLGPEHPDTLSSRNQLAIVLIREGKAAEAENTFREVIKLEEKVLGPENAETLLSKHGLAWSLGEQGKNVEAETRYREVVKLREKVLGPDHLETLGTRNNLASTLYDEGKYAEAEVQCREILKLEEKTLAPQHRLILMTLTNLALALDQQGKYADAEAQYRGLVNTKEKVLGSQHPETLITRKNLAITLSEQGKYAEAESQCRDIIELLAKVLTPEHPDTLNARIDLIDVLTKQGKYVEAESQCREVIKLLEKVLRPDHPLTLYARNSLAYALSEQGKYAEAEAQCREVIKLDEKVIGPEHPWTLQARANLANALNRQGNYAEGESQLRDVINSQQKTLGSNHPDTLQSCYYLALALSLHGKLEEAKDFAHQAAEGANKTIGPEHPSTKKYETLLGQLGAK
jgi:tetratricopeptide (TPR) repeat protein